MTGASPVDTAVREAGRMRTPWVVRFEALNRWGGLLAESPEEIESKYPEVRVVFDLPDWLKNDPDAIEALCTSAVDVDDETDPLLAQIRADRLKPRPWSRPVAGTVKWFNAEKGVGALSCDQTAPDDVWVHYSHIEGAGYRSLEEGEAVEMEFEPAIQDSFNFRALRVRRPQPPR
ncbi:MAG: cold-shock protein [Acidimicrobiia bacterium]